ncbi:RNA-binding S4 domain-containing protein [Enterovibrio sp. ZSDZ42]|uniref:RNA-binding S4 domain-containing protein n=1 Tax=Enterovibrio gelatinilyticus TaxID=2899819 RepID=A0ABT5QWM2_9GAMM|nr:RNA-binding S4 domain-containing protein [Enterovibrio sp. ZSDZ42]MDD1792134.1 RNA-binding S4 domain-containing protein [Enterovibrio sp. ZSDZ42]
MSHEEIEVEAIGIEVSAQPVELYKVLKIANAVSGGGEAKMAIVEGYVAVNGEIETRKRRKIHDGDVIQFNEEFYVLLCDAPPTPVEPRQAKPVKAQKNNVSASKKKPASCAPASSTVDKKPSSPKAPAKQIKNADKKQNKTPKIERPKQGKSSAETSKSDTATGRKLISF